MPSKPLVFQKLSKEPSKAVSTFKDERNETIDVTKEKEVEEPKVTLEFKPRPVSAFKPAIFSKVSTEHIDGYDDDFEGSTAASSTDSLHYQPNPIQSSVKHSFQSYLVPR
jgi:hypothetical protein